MRELTGGVQAQPRGQVRRDLAQVPGRVPPALSLGLAEGGVQGLLGALRRARELDRVAEPARQGPPAGEGHPVLPEPVVE